MPAILRHPGLEAVRWSLIIALVAAPTLASDAPVSQPVTNAEFRAYEQAYALEDESYRKARRIYRVGATSMAVALPVLLIGGVASWNECPLFGGPCTFGIDDVLFGAGIVLFTGGPLLAAVGSLRVADHIRGRGAAVARGAGIVGVLLASAGVAAWGVALLDTAGLDTGGLVTASAFGAVLLPPVAILAAWQQRSLTVSSTPRRTSLPICATTPPALCTWRWCATTTGRTWWSVTTAPRFRSDRHQRWAHVGFRRVRGVPDVLVRADQGGSTPPV